MTTWARVSPSTVRVSLSGLSAISMATPYTMAGNTRGATNASWNSLPAGEAVAHQREGGQGAQGERERGGDDGHREAHPEGAQELWMIDDVLEPLEGQALGRKAEMWTRR